ncbi:hypothetical protein DY000_02001077 [Brassica cretica]|uniref:Uncharacterized protein n=1 Tax=Brassica cretica TaxID=69181 RepID=A0ABQ7CKR5_BRACR|nr:hypothetical protein DY000_02001077 [Brassica cretica]
MEHLPSICNTPTFHELSCNSRQARGTRCHEMSMKLSSLAENSIQHKNRLTLTEKNTDCWRVCGEIKALKCCG